MSVLVWIVPVVLAIGNVVFTVFWTKHREQAIAKDDAPTVWEVEDVDYSTEGRAILRLVYTSENRGRDVKVTFNDKSVPRHVREAMPAKVVEWVDRSHVVRGDYVYVNLHLGAVALGNMQTVGSHPGSINIAWRSMGRKLDANPEIKPSAIEYVDKRPTRRED